MERVTCSFLIRWKKNSTSSYTQTHIISMKSFIISLILLALANQVVAQRWTKRKKYYSVTLGLGLLQELKDAEERNHFGYGLHLALNRRIRPHIEFGIELAHQRLSYNKRLLLNENSYSFQGNVFGRYYMFEDRSLFFKREEFNPFLRLGIGYLNVNTKFPNDQISNNSLAHHIGMGINWKLRNRYDLVFEFLRTSSFSENSDVIRKSYPLSSTTQRWKNWEFRVGFRYLLARSSTGTPRFR